MEMVFWNTAKRQRRRFWEIYGVCEDDRRWLPVLAGLTR